METDLQVSEAGGVSEIFSGGLLLAEKTCPTCGQKVADERAALSVREAWPRCQAVAAQYGKTWRALSANRRVLLAARLRELGPEGSPDALWQAIHGAVAYWKGLRQSEFDPYANLVPETIYRPSQFTKYLEHYRAPQAPKIRAPEPALAPRVTQAERDAATARMDALFPHLSSRLAVKR